MASVFADNNSDLTIKAYPVPATTNLTVAVPVQGSGKVAVYLVDLQGYVVYSRSDAATQGTKTVDVDVLSLPAGVYVLKVSTSQFTKSQFITIDK